MPFWFINALTNTLIAIITRLDEKAWTPLIPHENKIVCLDIAPIGKLYFKINKGLKSIPLSDAESVNTTISGTLTAFSTQRGLHIKGDLDCAKAVYDAAKGLDLDFEGELAKILGGSLAHFLCQGVHHGHASLRQVWEARTEDLGAYLQDEAKCLISTPESEDFFSDIDTLRHDVSRFEARLHLLKQRLQNKEV